MMEKEFADYLKSPGFKRLNKLLIDKYQKLGHFGGKLVLENLSRQEINDLSGLLGMNLSSGKLSITYHQFEKQIKQTRFEQCDLLKTLEILNKGKIYTKLELRKSYNQQLELFKNHLKDDFKETISYDWLSYYLDNDSMVKRYYDDNKDKYHDILMNVSKAINQLPIYFHQYELLAIFAQKITKDPHYFDRDLSRELLLKAISYCFKLDTSDINEIYYQAGILRDDLSNYCYICHIKEVNISIWDDLYEAYEPLNINLSNIQGMSRFVPTPIYILENPSVFRILCSYIQEHKLNVGLVCSNGQINFSTYLLLDKLESSGCKMYYAGDFDCEGLMIAQKLIDRYSNLILWKYEDELFMKIKVHQVYISSKRLTMLKSIKKPTLKKIADRIIQTHSFGYQEGLIEDYQKSIQSS